MRWFGRAWNSSSCVEEQHVEPPAAPCAWCDESINLLDNGVILDPNVPYHYACFMRQVIGSAAHVLGKCSCFVPGAHESDPPELTRRQAAELAIELFEAKNRKRFVRLKEDVFGRWMLVQYGNPHLAWSGSRWVAIDDRGISREALASNLGTVEEAIDYARQFGLEVVA